MPQTPSLFDSMPDNYHGLRLSDVLYHPPQHLQANPLNQSFEAMKDRLYLESLEADIARHGIVNALIATKAGVLIEGHSRWNIAQKLNLKEIPVRYILSDLSENELKERLYLSNLNRFEISKDARTKMYADLYPHIFYDETIAIPEELAKSMGLSLSQVRNERQLLLLAIKLKEEKDDTSPLSIEDLQKARKTINLARRERERLKRLQWQQPSALSTQQKPEPLPLFLSHEEEIQQPELDILEAYKLISLNARCYNIYTKNDQLIASLDPQTFLHIEELDHFAKSLILTFHHLRDARKDHPKD
ncbi:ParB/RepB/Spo0J family partition protein [Entomospira culicis]|uniref:ParB N-terminal domain-containing protein n=1 Tax=Entomospira culicis TaxID=2719989 RepID=A0A968KXB3_9SPIO|nr:ParB/RepB/Spo0J family partition protein [Entomospira culicis]NIZ19958.1 ParB N-terminal domain-containing protein [Entomospira culicis]NIZ70177.1 ParB N-terminal domain-containing protein [Entomospira culicis]WDI38010.1 ParB/RepB/Spo0J family partition protein [Entomospira culicis]WDI39633.1 ParB/RepB/Spo0J family partition protein [Entomospira culicis]